MTFITHTHLHVLCRKKTATNERDMCNNEHNERHILIDKKEEEE